MRKIMLNVDGVAKMQVLGKFAIAGKVTFTDNKTFIKANTKVKFKHAGDLVLDRENTRRTSGSGKGVRNRQRSCEPCK